MMEPNAERLAGPPPRPDRALWLAAAWSITAALAARHGGPAPGAVVAMLGVLGCLLRGRAGPGLLALPVFLLTAVPGPVAVAVPRPGPVRLDGVVRGPLQKDLDGSRCGLATAQGSVRLKVVGDFAALPGDRLRGVGSAGGSAVPGEPPPAILAQADALTVTPGPWSLPRLVAACRTALQERILGLWPGPRGAFLCTLVLGSGPPLADEVMASHRATGLSHLLAVSGAHASMLALLLGLLPSGLGSRRGVVRRRVAAAFLLLYGAITGLQPPMLRALCAFAVLAFTARNGRQAGLAAVLCPPAILTAAFWPDDLLGPSFQLSYAAVWGLWLGAFGRRETAAQRWLWAPLRMSLGASLATAPLTLLWFGTFAPCTVLATPLLAPLVTVLLALGLVLPVLQPALPLAAALAAPTGLLADLYLGLVRACDLLPGTPVFAWSVPGPWLLAAGALSGLLLLLRLGGRRGTGAFLLGACVPHFLPATAVPAPELHWFAVGHGQCALLRLPDGRNLVVDCGSLTHAALAARKVAATVTRRRIDLLVLTHGDVDHTAGVQALLQRLPVTAVLLPAELLGSPLAERLRRSGARTEGLRAGERTALPGLGTAFRPPVAGGASNDDSIWLRLALPGGSVLLPGDAEEPAVRAALAAGLGGAAPILALPHHGRAHGSIDGLLAAVRPRLCLCSNRQGDGRSVQGEAAVLTGAEVWATGECGDLVLTFTTGGVAIRPLLPRLVLGEASR